MIKISDAELEVMQVIWKRGETTSIQIIEDLKSSKWNYNTIRTLINRLQNKGAIEVCRVEGKLYTYRSKINESQYKNELTMELIRKLYHDSINEFIFEYCKANNVKPEQIQNVIDIIDEKERMEKEKMKKQ